MKNIFFYIIVLFFTGFCFTQNKTNSFVKKTENYFIDSKKIDSLYQNINNFIKNKNNENLIKLIILNTKQKNNWNYALRFTNELSNYYIYNNVDAKKADSIVTDFYPNLKKCTNKKDIGKFYTNFIEAAIYNQKQNKALDIIQKEAIPFFEKTKDSNSYDFAYTYLKAGEITTSSNMTKSIYYFNKAEKIFTKQKDTLFLLWTYNGLSSLYSNNGLYDEATKKREFIYRLAPIINQEQVAAMAHIRAAIDAQFLSKPKEALIHIEAALNNSYNDSDIKDIVETLTLSFAVSTYAQNNQLEKSNYYLKTLELKMKNQKNNPFLMGYYQISKAYNAYSKKNYILSEKIALQIFNTLKNDKINIRFIEIEYLLFKIYEKLGKTKLALNHYKNAIKYKNIINANNSKKRFAYEQTKFETAKKDLKIKNQYSEIAILKYKNERTNRQVLFGSIFLITLLVITYLYYTNRLTKQKQKQSQDFSRHLIVAQETERKRIARDLHDSIGQNLMLLKRKAEKINYGNLAELAESTLNEVRSITKALHPSILEKLGLTSAIVNFITEVDKNTKIFFTTEIDNIDNLITKENEVHLFRIIQECITNLVKHSNSKVAFIKIRKERRFIYIKIEDRGRGFVTNKKSNFKYSLGMKTLQERSSILKAIFNVKSELNSGTILEFNVPFLIK